MPTSNNVNNLLVHLSSLLTFLEFILANCTDICLDATAAQGATVHAAITSSCSFSCSHTLNSNWTPNSCTSPRLLSRGLCLLKHWCHSMGTVLPGSLPPKHRTHYLSLSRFSAYMSLSLHRQHEPSHTLSKSLSFFY